MIFKPNTNTSIDIKLPIEAANWDSYSVELQLMNNNQNKVPSFNNISMITKLMSLVDEDFLLFSGDDDQIVPLLSVGASGVISVLSNVAPRETHEICQKWFDGDIKGAREAQFMAYPLIKALFAEVNPIPVKAALNLMGKNVGSLRLPMTEATDSTKALLKDEMTKYGIL